MLIKLRKRPRNYRETEEVIAAILDSDSESLTLITVNDTLEKLLSSRTYTNQDS